jgi:DNA repair exonuclease SbcCD ATPase subunit
LNLELQKQRKQYREQIDELNEQLEIKCQECKNLINELNHKDKLLRENSKQYDDDYDGHKVIDDNKRLHRELMILKDDSNKYKLQLNQLYREVESYKASLYSYEKHCEKLKNLNSELNKTLSEEREQNEKGRQKVRVQMSSLNNKVSELEGFSMSVENTNRDFHKKSDYLMQRMLDVREYIISGDAFSHRSNAAPGTVRSNLSGMFSSVSKNPLEFNNCDENAEEITRDKFDDLKRKIFNYQNAINKLQGEKQQVSVIMLIFQT